MNKKEILKEIFDIEDVYSKLVEYNKRCKYVDYDNLLNTLSKETYVLRDDLNLSDATVSRLMSCIFPDRPKTRTKPCTFLLEKYGYKYCAYCKEVKTVEEFNLNKAKSDGMNGYCKVCHNATNATTQAGRTSLYRASKINRTPEWSDSVKLKEIYKNCPGGMHVDHIIPLNGELVSGLHVPENLQYLSASENTSKYNKYTIE